MVYKIYRTHVVARWNPVEHRHRHRVPAFLDVLIYQGGVPAAAGTVRNVSRDGLFINTDFDAVGVNQQVDLEFSLPAGGEPQSRRMSAVVLRKTDNGFACECADAEDDCHFIALSDLIAWLKSNRLPHSH